MLIIGLNASPRKGGNSRLLLEEALKVLPCATEIVDLADVSTERCRACDVCGKTKDTGRFVPCIFEGKDQAGALLERIATGAAGVIFSTPVYFGLPTPLLVDFLNRTRYLRHQDFRLANKVFGVIAVAGRRSGGGETTIFSTWYPCIRNGMIPAGNGDKSCQFGAVGWAGGRGEAREDEWGLVQARDLALRVHDLARVIEAGSAALGWKNPMRFDYPSGTLRESLQRPAAGK